MLSYPLSLSLKCHLSLRPTPPPPPQQVVSLALLPVGGWGEETGDNSDFLILVPHTRFWITFSPLGCCHFPCRSRSCLHSKKTEVCKNSSNNHLSFVLVWLLRIQNTPYPYQLEDNLSCHLEYSDTTRHLLSILPVGQGMEIHPHSSTYSLSFCHLVSCWRYSRRVLCML